MTPLKIEDLFINIFTEVTPLHMQFTSHKFQHILKGFVFLTLESTFCSLTVVCLVSAFCFEILTIRAHREAFFIIALKL